MTNGEIVRSYVQALAGGDTDAVRGLLAEDAVMHVPGRNRLSGKKRGADEIVAFVEALDVSDIEPHDVLENDDHVVVLVRRKIAGVEADAAVVYHVRDGKIGSIWLHEQDQYAVDEAIG